MNTNFDPHDIPHDFLGKNTFGLSDAMDKPIYRIFQKDRLIQALQTKQLCLANPSLWDDPFENFLLTRTATFQGQRVSLKSFQEKLYGQCWSFCKESDAMWRI